MPFTLSHIAAILPLQGATRTGTTAGDGAGRHGPLVASALAFGAMAPDVILFVNLDTLPVRADRAATHELWPGVLGLNIALTVLLVIGFHLLARPLLVLLPDGVRSRLEEPLRPVLPGRLRAAARARAPFVREGLTAGAWFVVSAILGGLTHIGWDAWTHHNDPGVAHVLPELRHEFFGLRPGYVLLQHVSTVLGLVACAVWTRRWIGRLPERPLDGPRMAPGVRWGVVGALTLAGLLGASQAVLPLPDGRVPAFEVLGFDVATGFGRGLATGLVLYGAAWASWHHFASRRVTA
ncbi:DUF4184 family protein [Streptomyces sp. SID3343]|uniref:DUF4184 family protein n=1 Tax=Streptomyces sp. SID3343 TaxID=2690260 RepID=UPI0013716C5F|nr:DUF4184 family protein [Streptomyces sp. SID3343]MYW00728.1 DUF4184 family protein [Streptomyces sp. SID3343]